MFNKILLCSDGSHGSLQAARVAGKLAKAPGAEILALNVLDLLNSAVFFLAPEVAPPLDITMKDAEEAQQCALDATGKALAEEGACFQMRKESGHPVDGIRCVAESEKVDLIVMGSRGLGGFKRHLLGSVSDAVLHHALGSVLVVR